MNQELSDINVDFVNIDEATKHFAKGSSTTADERPGVNRDVLDSNSQSSGEYEYYEEYEVDENGNPIEEDYPNPNSYYDSCFGCIKRLIVNLFLGLIYNSFKSGILRSDN